jgi:hypothetical protein
MMIVKNQQGTGLIEENKIWLEKPPNEITQEILKVIGQNDPGV